MSTLASVPSQPTVSAPTSTLLEVRGLKVHFPIRHGVIFDRTVGHVRAVDGVDLSVTRGG